MASRKVRAGATADTDGAVKRGRYSVLGPCALCGVYEGRGYYYVKDLFNIAYPEYGFCSLECSAVGMLLAGETGHMPLLTDMELQAIKETRPVLYECLCLLKKEKQFDGWTAQEIDALILSCAEGVRRSLQKQSALDPDKVPY
jgi:hypothetical protein